MLSNISLWTFVKLLENSEFPAQRASDAEMLPFYDVIMKWPNIVGDHVNIRSSGGGPALW